MEQNLLILGAGIYGLVVKELADSTGQFQKIAFVDDGAKTAPDGTAVAGTTKELPALAGEYTHAVVAIGNPEVRRKLVELIEKTPALQLATLVSPKAYVSPSAKLGTGCVVEPMAVVHAGCTLGNSCLICAGAVINHGACCGDFVQVDCNVTLCGFAQVPDGSKLAAGSVYVKK